MPAYLSIYLSIYLSVYSTNYRRADNSRPVSFTVNTWEWVYATNLTLLQRETREREREKETRKRHVGGAHIVLTSVILLPQRPSCYWTKIVPLRMLTNLRLADLRLTTAQQRSTCQNQPSDLYLPTYLPRPVLGSTKSPREWVLRSVSPGVELQWYGVHQYQYRR
jgi:hypothetical protein